MANAATHSGHCQACGRLQKLPNGKLAKHGYKVSHGYFSGVCTGSGQLPFEQSYDMLPGFIASAQSSLKGVSLFQLSLRAPATEPLAWFSVREYRDSGRRFGYAATYSWKQCNIREEVKTSGDGTFTYSKYYRDGDTKMNRTTRLVEPCEAEVSQYSHGKTLSQVVVEANEVYAKWLQHEVDSLARYIAWQEGRIKTWAPAALLPVEHKDKEGFKPTEPAY